MRGRWGRREEPSRALVKVPGCHIASIAPAASCWPARESANVIKGLPWPDYARTRCPSGSYSAAEVDLSRMRSVRPRQRDVLSFLRMSAWRRNPTPTLCPPCNPRSADVTFPTSVPLTRIGAPIGGTKSSVSSSISTMRRLGAGGFAGCSSASLPANCGLSNLIVQRQAALRAASSCRWRRARTADTSFSSRSVQSAPRPQGRHAQRFTAAKTRSHTCSAYSTG